MAIAIHTRTIERLRDTLRESGQRPSMVLSGAYETLARAGLLSLEEQMAIARVEPLGEIMYLMMAADGDVADVERDVLRGAIRGLTDDGVRSGTLKVMLERFERDALAYGRDARLAELTSLLVDDRAGAEGAFVLAAAVAFADGEIRPEESDVIDTLAARLAISEERANQLLDTLEEDASGG